MSKTLKRWIALPYWLLIIIPAIAIHQTLVFLLGGKHSKYGSKVENWSPDYDFLWLDAVYEWLKK